MNNAVERRKNGCVSLYQYREARKKRSLAARATLPVACGRVRAACAPVASCAVWPERFASCNTRRARRSLDFQRVRSALRVRGAPSRVSIAHALFTRTQSQPIPPGRSSHGPCMLFFPVSVSRSASRATRTPALVIPAMRPSLYGKRQRRSDSFSTDIERQRAGHRGNLRMADLCKPCGYGAGYAHLRSTDLTLSKTSPGALFEASSRPHITRCPAQSPKQGKQRIVLIIWTTTPTRVVLSMHKRAVRARAQKDRKAAQFALFDTVDHIKPNFNRFDAFPRALDAAIRHSVRVNCQVRALGPRLNHLKTADEGRFSMRMRCVKLGLGDDSTPRGISVAVLPAPSGRSHVSNVRDDGALSVREPRREGDHREAAAAQVKAAALESIGDRKHQAHGN